MQQLPRSLTEASCAVEILKLANVWLVDAPWLTEAVCGDAWGPLYMFAIREWRKLVEYRRETPQCGHGPDDHFCPLCPRNRDRGR